MTDDVQTDLPDPASLLIAGKDWSSRDVMILIWGEQRRRFDSIDHAVAEVRGELRDTAKQEDVRALHERVDAVVDDLNQRLVPLEEEAKAQQAIDGNRSNFRRALLTAAGAAASVAIVVSALWEVFTHAH
jgi:Flp pilus assembly protein TadB